MASTLKGSLFGLVMILAGSVAEAGPVYSITDLGPADPNSSYLNALAPSDQGAFNSGSFDRWTHPGNVE